LSRNGSSSAFKSGTGAAAAVAVLHPPLRGGGSPHSTLGQGNRVRSAGPAESDDDEIDVDDTLPFADQDEGFVDTEEWNGMGLGSYRDDEPVWSFGGLGARNAGSGAGSAMDDELASDLPALGSEGGEDLVKRLKEDFPDHGGDGEMRGDDLALVGDDEADGGNEEVHEIHVSGD
jgi:hypothetical protein